MGGMGGGQVSIGGGEGPDGGGSPPHNGKPWSIGAKKIIKSDIGCLKI